MGFIFFSMESEAKCDTPISYINSNNAQSLWKFLRYSNWHSAKNEQVKFSLYDQLKIQLKLQIHLSNLVTGMKDAIFFDFKKQINIFLAFLHLLKIWLNFDKFWELFGDQVLNTMFESNKMPVYLN